MGIQIAFDLIHHFYMESCNKETFILSSKRATKRIFSWSIGIHNKNTVFLTRQTIWTVLLADIWRNKKKFGSSSVLESNQIFPLECPNSSLFEHTNVTQEYWWSFRCKWTFICMCQLSCYSNTCRPDISWGENTFTSPYA